MKKYCSQCNREFDADARWCDQCGSELISQIPVSAPQGPSIQQDNRIHKGDKTDIAGDNISAQSVDKRTFITQNSEAKMYMECQLSGSRVPMEDIRRCTKCHRAVAVKYFNEDYFLCKECYENKRQSEDKAGIPPLAPPPVQQITPVAQPVSSPTQPTPAQAPAKSSAKLYLALAIALLVIVVLGVKMFVSDSAESAVEVTEKPVVAQTEDNVQSQEPQKKAEQPVAETKAEPVKRAASAPAAPSVKEKAPAAAQVQTGKSAYQAGNYAQAAILLQKELDKGDGSAAYLLSKMYAQGQGVSSNVRKAFSYMRQAAELDCSDAYYELAEMYRLGDGTETNRARAKTWYEKAVETNAKNASLAAEKLNLY